MSPLPKHMQAALNLRDNSPVTDKVGATITGTDQNGESFVISRTNFWPGGIQEKIGTDTKIGNASGTVHAEVAAMMAAPITQGASMYTTEAPCPNCTKYMAEAGIDRIYVRKDAFTSDFYIERRREAFENMSLKIAQDAGMRIYSVSEDGTEEELTNLGDQNLQREFEAASVEKLDNVKDFQKRINETKSVQGNDVYALGLAEDSAGNSYLVSAIAAPVTGHVNGATEGPAEGKYSYYLQPVDRTIMAAARHGLKLREVFSSRAPTSREQVNFLGTGLTEITIENISESRDEHALRALKQLQDANILAPVSPTINV